jgi:putative ABC transport system permease protein
MRDVRYAFRILLRDPGFAMIAILALALGIGANTAIFSVVNAALLRPLPYPDGARLMVVWDRLSKLGIAQFPVSYANYLDYKAGNRVFEDVAAFSSAEFNLTTAEQAERVPGVYVSANLLEIMGAVPAAAVFFSRKKIGPVATTLLCSAIPCGAGALAAIQVFSAKR